MILVLAGLCILANTLVPTVSRRAWMHVAAARAPDLGELKPPKESSFSPSKGTGLESRAHLGRSLLGRLDETEAACTGQHYENCGDRITVMDCWDWGWGCC